MTVLWVILTVVVAVLSGYGYYRLRTGGMSKED
jgi:hypothetical protein